MIDKILADFGGLVLQDQMTTTKRIDYTKAELEKLVNEQVINVPVSVEYDDPIGSAKVLERQRTAQAQALQTLLYGEKK